MKASVLQSIHDSLGAEFVEIGGWSLPAHYGNMASEYRALRISAGLFDASARGKLRVTGSDRARFLHGMVTNRVEGLEEGESNHAAMTDTRGNTLADLWIHDRGDTILLETEPGLQKKVAANLDRYLISDDVLIEDVTADFAVIGIDGPEANARITDVIANTPSDLTPGRTVTLCHQGAKVELTAYDPADRARFQLWIEPGGAVRLWTSLVEAGARPVGFEALEILRIEAGVPRYGADVDERAIPLEAGLFRAVDFNKGCFIGQETIAKMHHRGKPRKYLVGLLVERQTVAEPGTPILEGEKEIGRITSCARSPALSQVIALGSVRRGFEASGTVLSLKGGGRVEVTPLPFRQTAVPA